MYNKCLFPLFIISLNHVQQKRFQNDMAINNYLIDVLQDQKWEPIPWKKLQVGDIVRVSILHFNVFVMGCILMYYMLSIEL